MKRRLFWVLGLSFTIITTVFFIAPSIFLIGNSIWGEYDSFKEINNFNSHRYDLYRKVSDVSITLKYEEPIFTLNEDDVTYLVYSVKEKITDNKWPHKYVFDLIDNSKLGNFNSYCITALQNNEVIAKRCVDAPFEEEEFIELFSVSGFQNENVRIIASLEVMTINASNEVGLSQAYITLMKKRYTNDKDLFIHYNLAYE